MDAISQTKPLTDEQRIDWLRLIRSDSVGPQTFRSLVNHFGSARDGAGAPARPGTARRRGTAGRICCEDDARAELAAAQANSASCWSHLEKPVIRRGWPMLDDAPPLLGVRGAHDVLMRPMIAIVGSRNASGAGLKFAATLAHELGDAGFVIVSGLARGIDQAAHRASIGERHRRGAGRRPRSDLSGRARGSVGDDHRTGGAAISEMPLGHVPRARDFPRRNRLISGAALGVVMVEAARRSGSLITARIAAEQGREVFAVPGSPLDPRAAGTNDLIKQGATLDHGGRRRHQRRRADHGAADRHCANPTMSRWQMNPMPSDRARIVGLLGPSPVRLTI